MDIIIVNQYMYLIIYHGYLSFIMLLESFKLWNGRCSFFRLVLIYRNLFGILSQNFSLKLIFSYRLAGLLFLTILQYFLYKTINYVCILEFYLYDIYAHIYYVIFVLLHHLSLRIISIPHPQSVWLENFIVKEIQYLI